MYAAMKLLLTIFLTLMCAQLWANDVASMEKACEAADGLACAKTAYHFRRAGDAEKAYKFYKKGCELKDETACHNMAALDPRDIYFKKIDVIFKFHKTNISNCYIPKVTKRIESALETKWHKVDIIIHINKSGSADLVNINTALSNDFKKCADKIIRALEFPKPENIDPTYSLNLTIESQE